MVREDIRVLYYTDPTAFQIFGGGEIQMLRTKEHLEKMKKQIYVKLFDAFRDRLVEYDILHVFHMRPDCLSICRLAKIEGLRIVLSPIYWSGFRNVPGMTWKYASVFEEIMSKTKSLYVNFRNYKYPTVQTLYPYKDFLELSDIILPNSRIEAADLSHEFRIDSSKFFPVHLGVEKSYLNARPDAFVKKHGLKDFVLYVGRIDQGKNILTLLQACENIEIPLVLIGRPNNWEQEYFKKCKQVAEKRRNSHFLGFLPPDSEELISAYAAAKVFVLPSWLEIPGLSALEAGLAGCNIVITSRGSTREYFKNYALYVNPGSKEDIREKILEAYEKPKNDNLKQYILNNYTWEKTAERTLEAYSLTLNSSSKKTR